MKRIISADKMIGDARRKFLAFSAAGIAAALLFSVIALRYHTFLVSSGKTVQSIYRSINKHIFLINNIALTSDELASSEFGNDRKQLELKLAGFLNNLDSENAKLQRKLASSENLGLGELKRLIEEDDYIEKLRIYSGRARDLIDGKPDTLLNTKNDVLFLKEGYRSSMENVLMAASSQAKNSLEQFNKQLMVMGYAVVGLCLVGLILVWLFVFKPLYSTILAQHHELLLAIQREQGANRAKVDFLANISHEIRTPMTAILGYAKMLKSSGVDPKEMSNYVSIIDRNANHLISLVDEILDVSKIEAGKLEILIERINFIRVLNEVYSLMHAKAKSKGIDLVLKSESIVPTFIFADLKRTKQILFNIIGNAIKFTAKGSVEIRVVADQEKETLYVDIVDTGIGIDPTKFDSLFQPFEQGDSSVDREFGGTGLGLVLSQRLARAQKGDVKLVRSIKGQGSTFRVSFAIGKHARQKWQPFIPTHLKGDMNTHKSVSNELKGMNLLVVDDAKENARMFAAFLREYGASVDVANSGSSALDKVVEVDYDLVLLDLQMPGKDGFQVLKEMRALHFANPIVALTAHAMTEEKQKTKEAGFQGHITKPVEPDDLVQSIVELADSR